MELSNTTHVASNLTFSIGVSADVMALQQNVRMMNLYLKPVVISIGLASNLCAALVISTVAMRKAACSVYFLAILIANEFFLLIFMHEWLTQQVGVSLYGLVGGWCQFATFTGKSADFLSVWYPVCLILDRCIYSIRPEIYAEICSTWKARMLVILLCIISIMIFLNTSLTFGVFYTPSPLPQMPYCSPLTIFERTTTILSHADVIVNGVLGYGTIIALLIRILVEKTRLFRANFEVWFRQRQLPEFATSDGIPETQDSQPQMEESMTKGQTVAALTYIILFLLCNLPLQGFRTKNMILAVAQSSHMHNVSSYLIKEILVVLKLVSFSSLLFVLLVVHSGFRHHLAGMLRDLCCRCVQMQVDTPDIEMNNDGGYECRLSKSSIEESSTVEFVSHESAYV
ncbi:hypothetical protein CAPTEDRAFT_202133 [Capitella teleta]|uniref:G-protein coupled receptors family 1 profile domain-containing protein n=1 Tax=Capitella teleta TaxID=283909 RepID=R7U438_CAPTE|nr:hypothetical protein CAPTEDRAFT_202133 [Capitella teleta]|eukprot:ELU00739.1 hypothetical protein CAPTEDRAFT_202133 [Capitella teleta]